MENEERERMKPKVSLGIDPGSQSGHFATILHMERLGEDRVDIKPFREVTLAELYQIFKEIAERYDCDAVCENVHAFPGMSAIATSSFMKNMGHIEMALAASGIPTRYVSPQTWMKFYGVKKDKGETKTVWKKRLREVLQQRLPHVECTTEQADAVLIALYGRCTRV
jgi:Holliday junction resolvasome RuvABC endonuclease subunit